MIITDGRLPPPSAFPTNDECALRLDCGALNAGVAQYAACGNDEGEQAEVQGRALRRGGNIVCKGPVNTGQGWPRPKSDKDIQL